MIYCFSKSSIIHCSEWKIYRREDVSKKIWIKDDILESCLKFVSEHLKENGVFMANVNIGERPTGSWLEFPVMFKTFEFYVPI